MLLTNQPARPLFNERIKPFSVTVISIEDSHRGEYIIILFLVLSFCVTAVIVIILTIMTIQYNNECLCAYECVSVCLFVYLSVFLCVRSIYINIIQQLNIIVTLHFFLYLFSNFHYFPLRLVRCRYCVDLWAVEKCT